MTEAKDEGFPHLAGTDVEGFALPEFELAAMREAEKLHPLIQEYADEVVDVNRMPPIVRYLNVYIVERSYGGPEEGGWWYDVGTPFGVSIVCNTIGSREMQDLYDFLIERYPSTDQRFSMAAAGDDFQVRIEKQPPKEWPTERPHYE